MRNLLGAVAVAVALSLYWLGAVFGLNGDQWTWWQFAAWSAAALSLFVALSRMIVARVIRGRRRRVFVTAGLLGLVLLGGSLTLMASRYSDPYAGPLFWPHVLALIGLLGFMLLQIAAAALVLRRTGRRSGV